MNPTHPAPRAGEPGTDTAPVSRRTLMQRGAAASALAATGLRAAPVPAALAALAALARGAQAQAASPAALVVVLNFALTLEYLEDEFYRTALASPVGATLTPAERATIEQVSKHETAHVKFLQTAIASFQGTPVAKPRFDFTARGTFADVFSNKATFLALAQAFEDTGVRAYKGQAGAVMSNPMVLTAALQIHAVEARHASQIRRLRGQKAWVTGADRGTLPAQAQGTYDGENNTTHKGIDAAAFAGTAGAAAATEAFDEPLSMAEVTTIVSRFIAG